MQDIQVSGMQKVRRGIIYFERLRVYSTQYWVQMALTLAAIHGEFGVIYTRHNTVRCHYERDSELM